MIENLSCPSCAAPLAIENRFAKMVTCDFCGHVSLIKDSGLDPTGRTAKLVQLPSIFYVDATGTIRGQSFRTLGRLRYQTVNSYWDEWFLVFDDGRRGWLVEDEGEFTFYAKKTLTGSVPPFDTVQAGTMVQIDGRNVFITEKGEAKIAGGEGQLAFTIMPGERIDYIDGTSDGKLVSLEYAEDEIEFAIGQPIGRDEIVLDEPDYF